MVVPSAQTLLAEQEVGGVVGRVLGAALEGEGRADHAIERGEVRGGGSALDAAQHHLGVDVDQPIECAVEVHGGPVHLGGDSAESRSQLAHHPASHVGPKRLRSVCSSSPP